MFVKILENEICKFGRKLIFFSVLSHGQDKDRSGVPTFFKPIHATKAYLYYLADSWLVLKR